MLTAILIFISSLAVAILLSIAAAKLELSSTTHSLWGHQNDKFGLKLRSVSILGKQRFLRNVETTRISKIIIIVGECKFK